MNFQEIKNNILSWLESQESVQELKAKWSNLDHETQNAIQTFGLIFSFVLVFGSLGFLGYDRFNQVQLLENKKKILKSFQEINATGESRVNLATSEDDVKTEVESRLKRVNIKEFEFKKITQFENTPLEVYFQIKAKTNLKDLTKFSTEIENSNFPIRVRTLEIKTLDIEGNLEVQVEVSSFIESEAS